MKCPVKKTIVSRLANVDVKTYTADVFKIV